LKELKQSIKSLTQKQSLVQQD